MFRIAQFIEANLEGVTAVNVTATKAKFQKANLKNAGTSCYVLPPSRMLLCLNSKQLPFSR